MAPRKDVNPQFLAIGVLESAANTFTEGEIPTPNIAEAGYVMEILKVYAEIAKTDKSIFIAADQVDIALYDRTRTERAFLSEAGMICTWRIHCFVDTSGGHFQSLQKEWDFTDSGGNGFLYGKKKLYAYTQGFSSSEATRISFRILYRLKKVAVTELVGLVQD